jgi:acyl-CoA thioesterase
MKDLPDQVAQMWARDAAAHALGITLVCVGDQAAELRLLVGPQHLNSHAMCHGGVIFTLADCCFAYASNGGDEMAVAQANQITYLAPGRAGDVLVARAVLVSRAGRSGIYDVTVSTGEGAVLALLRAQARFVGPHSL